MSKEEMIKKIMQYYKVSNIIQPFKAHSPDKILLELICCNESELKNICFNLNINAK